MSSHVTLKSKAEIARTLSSIVAKSFGPECGQTLLCTSTGKVVVTSDGMTIIGAVHMSHPVARLIVDCVRKLHRNVSDGVKTFLLYLCHALSSLDKIHDRRGMGKYGHNHGNSIVTQLHSIQSRILPQIWEDLKSSSVSSSSGSMERLKAIIDTALSSHMTKQHQRHLSDVILDTIVGPDGHLDLDDVHRRVTFMVTNFGFLHFKVAKQLVDSSSAVQGFIVRRDFALKLADIENHDGVKFVLMMSSIEGSACEEPDEVISVKNQSQFSQMLTYRRISAEKLLKRLHQKEVALIITSEKVPAYVLSVCREFNISVVSLVDVEDIQFLELLTGLQAITSPLDAVGEHCLGELAHCQRKTIGPHKFVHMSFREQTRVVHQPWTVVIASPTDGMVDQLTSVMFKAYKCVQMCFDSRNLSYIPAFDKSTKNYDGVNIVGAKLQNSSEAHPSSGKSSECFAIAGGGYFEFKTASVLKEVSNDFTDPHIGDGCRVLHDCLLAVPRALHRQLSGNSTTEAREYLQKLQSISTAVSGSEAIGLDRRSRVCDPVGKGILEPLATKVHVLSAVIQLLQQLVRIDTIVSVRRLEVPSPDTED